MAVRPLPARVAGLFVRVRGAGLGAAVFLLVRSPGARVPAERRSVAAACRRFAADVGFSLAGRAFRAGAASTADFRFEVAALALFRLDPAAGAAAAFVGGCRRGRLAAAGSGRRAGTAFARPAFAAPGRFAA